MFEELISRRVDTLEELPREIPAATDKLVVEKEQQCLFDIEPTWKQLWRGMPDFEQADLKPWASITVHFQNCEDRQAFAELIKQPISDLTKFAWFPKIDFNNRCAGHFSDRKWVTETEVLPRYPIYIPSKNRSESRLTSRALEEIGAPYYIVIEPYEYEQYAAVIAPEKILKLPWSKPNSSTELVKARNWIKDHSISTGAKRHWQLDDNISGFVRLKDNTKIKVASAVAFRVIEDFVDRYENVAIAGMNYDFFAKAKQRIPPLVLNTRVYSCSLISNELPHRWRGVYNDDTDICLRVLKDGFCTALFNAFLCCKAPTMTVKGGNTDIYGGDGRLKMAQSLVEQHPDVVRITQRFGRDQHYVNYRPFKRNRLILKEGAQIQETPNNYGMTLQLLDQ